MRVPKPETYRSGESSGAARRHVQQQGLGLPRRPIGETPELPSDLTELGDSALMTLFRKIMAWSKYLATQLAMAEIDEKDANAKVTRAEAHARQEVAKSAEVKLSATEIKAEAYEYKPYRMAAEAAQDIYAYRKLVNSLSEGLEQDAFLLSRELSRRLGTADRDSRDRRWNT